MKLVEILARDLEEWPAGVNKLHQSIAGMIFYIDSAAQVVKLVRTDVSRDWRETSVTRADWEAERAKLKEPKANADGWVRHRGGKCPVDGEIKVETRQRGGQKVVEQARDFWWEHLGNNGDIMAYRIHKPAEQTCLVEARAAERLATLDPAKAVSLEEMEQRFAGPLEWRDRIRELDTQRAEVESTHQRQISKITQERESLVQQLAGEGLALAEVVVQPVEDMSDPANWRKGDFIECVKATDSNGITVGKIYELTYVTEGCIGFLDDDGDHRDRGDAEKFKWHSRPAS